MRPRIWLSMLTLALVALTPAAAAAQDYNEPLPMGSFSPQDGASFDVRNGVPIAWEITDSIRARGAFSPNIEVATQNVAGQDGTLADDFVVDFFGLYESDATPGIYRGQSNRGGTRGGQWLDAPGTYYWQAHGHYSDYSTPVMTLRYYKSPVFTIVIKARSTPTPAPAPAPAPSMVSDTAAQCDYWAAQENKRWSAYRKAKRLYGKRKTPARRRAMKAALRRLKTAQTKAKLACDV